MDFQTALENKGIILSEKQLNQFERYYQLLVEWNEKMNLTAITDHDDVSVYKELDNLNIERYYNGRIIPGCEFTTSFDNRLIEVLGYGFNYKIKCK